MKKQFETLTGAFVTWDRATLQRAGRATLQVYLEQRGFAVYASDSMQTLRTVALEDFDTDGQQVTP